MTYEKLTLTKSKLNQIIINTLGSKCFDCPATEKLLVHHTDYKEGMTIKDLEILCRKCHGKRRRPTGPQDDYYSPKILALLDKPMCAGEIKERLNQNGKGVHKVTVCKRLKKLEREGKIKCLGGYPKFYIKNQP